MNDLKDRPEKQTEEITVTFIFQDGREFIQSLPVDMAEAVQDLIDWFRNPKSAPVWTWWVPSVQKAHLLHKSHIMGIDIDGYIEPEGESSKWYERWIDKVRTNWMLRG